KIIDPDAPRRPANAFMFFCDQNRELLKKERGTMREADIKSQGLSNLTKALGVRWKALDAVQRQEWGQKFKSEVKRFEGEMADY
ncbi:high mobility group box domain-containing protein, partial [Geranomyces variabilis]